MQSRFCVVLAILGSVALIGLSAQAYEFRRTDLNAIQIGGEIGRRIDVTVHNNLLVLDVENEFLVPFRAKEMDRDGGFVGLGTLIDAMTRLAYHTGDADLVARKKHIVAEAMACQEEDGYLGIMREEARVRKCWDVHEMGYIILGFTSDYALFNEDRSLDAARKLADYLTQRLTQTPPPDVFDASINPDMPITGVAEAFLTLSEQSGDPRYKSFCNNVLGAASWRKPIVKGRWGLIDGHVYAYLDKCLVQLRQDPSGHIPPLQAASKGVLDFLLWQDGLAITGACGDHECWHDTQAGMTNLGETCASTYLLKFYDELLRQTGNALYGDLMERTIYNTLFAAQSPDGRRIRYYTPFEAPRSYFDKDTYCCPNNYRRGISDLPGYVVYTTDVGMAVNLYTPCTVEVRLAKGGTVKLRQETNYPNSGQVAVHVDACGDEPFVLSYRIPRWCAEPRATLNGDALSEAPMPGTFYSIERAWSPGDVVTLDIPMLWRLVKGRRAQAGRVAVMRGPQIFTLNPERNEGMEAIEPRLLTLDVDSLEGPFPDNTVRPDGQACTVQVWDPGAWYPGTPSRKLRLTDFADPGATFTYFQVPNPSDKRYVDDALLSPTDNP